jgi:plastocyanin
VPIGATVTWVNRDPFPHTATDPGVFDSRSIAPDGRFSWRAARAGRYEYICSLHPNMKGVIVVE